MIMSFCVVKTVENGQVFITTVPSIWIKGKTLYFPSMTEWKSLRTNKAPPEIDWKKYVCEKKGTYESLEEALQAEKLLAKFDDTEDEENYFQNLKERRAHPASTLLHQGENDNIIYNDKFRKIMKNGELNIQGEQFGEINIVGEQSGTMSEELVSDDFQSEDITLSNAQNVIVVDEGLTNSVNEIKREMLILNIKSDKILNILTNKVTVIKNSAMLGVDEENHESDDEPFDFPIKTSGDLTNLEEKLGDKLFFKELTKRFSIEYSRAGLPWKKIAYLLIDQLVERTVLKAFTWTGSSKKKTKASFCALVCFNKLFNSIVKAGDPTYTQLNHEDFFKHSILKYSEARALPPVKGVKKSSTPRVSVCRKKPMLPLSPESETEESSTNETET